MPYLKLRIDLSRAKDPAPRIWIQREKVLHLRVLTSEVRPLAKKKRARKKKRAKRKKARTKKLTRYIYYSYTERLIKQVHVPQGEGERYRALRALVNGAS
jgi:hypothetical protein